MNKIKSICIISDSFIPNKNSAAGMIYNLGLSLKKHGYFVTFIYGGSQVLMINTKIYFHLIN